MRRTNIYLDDGALGEVRRRAAETARTSSDIIREAVANMLRPVPEARAAPSPPSPGLRRASPGFPASPDEWTQRPYFIHDYDISWAELLTMIAGADAQRRWWALARILESARWADVWRLLTPDMLRRDWPHLRFRNKEVWGDLIGPHAA